MDTKNTAGESVVNTANDTQGNASKSISEQAAKIADLEARLARESRDKEIYRSGLLAAKELGKSSKRITSEDLEDPERLEKAIDAKFQERELEQKAAQEAQQKIDDAEKLRKENEELRRSLEAAKTSGYSSGSSMGSGHNEHSEAKQVGYWSDVQKNSLREIYASRGLYTQDQIEKMVMKAEEIARTNTALSERKNDLAKTRQY